MDERGDPADVAATRQSVRLALVAVAQVLPARQRAAFLLCDVCAQPGAEAAEVLGVSVAALKSLLQRARARLEQHTVSDEELAEPTDERARRVLDRYMAAFEQSDMPAIERLLADDAVLEMTGTTTWYSGKARCVPFIATHGIGKTGEWRMLPLHVNGQLGAASYASAATGDGTSSPSSCCPRARRTSPGSRSSASPACSRCSSCRRPCGGTQPPRPLSRSSRCAASVFVNASSPMPRSTSGVFVNWISR
jgi:hypothetical protein